MSISNSVRQNLPSPNTLAIQRSVNSQCTVLYFLKYLTHMEDLTNTNGSDFMQEGAFTCTDIYHLYIQIFIFYRQGYKITHKSTLHFLTSRDKFLIKNHV
jgi:hypothetical protein